MPHNFLWVLTHALISKDLHTIMLAVKDYAGECIHLRENTTTCYTTMNLATSLPAARYNLVGGIFDNDDDGVVRCVECNTDMYVNCEIAIMQWDLYTSSPTLENYVVPRIGDVWSAEKVFLRSAMPGKAECPHCNGSFFKWISVPFNPDTAKYPLTMFVQRHRPVVEGINHPPGRVPIPPNLRVGIKTYQYCGWTAKMGEMSMVPFVRVNAKKCMRYSFTPGGMVQFLTDTKFEFPSDPRHLDMLIYKMASM